MHAEISLEQLSLREVAAACAESQRSSTNQSRLVAQEAPNACLELFRRAIKERDQAAWDIIYEQYRRIVFSWVSRNPVFYSTGESAEYFAQDAFMRMWRHLTPEKFDRLNDLRSLMAYLKMCVNSTLIDFMRRQDQPTEELQETTPHAEEPSAVEQLDRAQLWQLVSGQVQNDKEWLVVRGLFVWGYKPNELSTKYDSVFRDVKEVYTIRENVMNRLRRNRAIREYFGTND